MYWYFVFKIINIQKEMNFISWVIVLSILVIFTGKKSAVWYGTSLVWIFYWYNLIRIKVRSIPYIFWNNYLLHNEMIKEEIPKYCITIPTNKLVSADISIVFGVLGFMLFRFNILKYIIIYL